MMIKIMNAHCLIFFLFNWTNNFPGPSVTVGVSLYVLSISRLSEVDMVIMHNTKKSSRKDTSVSFINYSVIFE